MIFSEESRRTIREQGNIELYELRHMSSTTRAASICWKDENYEHAEYASDQTKV